MAKASLELTRYGDFLRNTAPLQQVRDGNCSVVFFFFGGGGVGRAEGGLPGNKCIFLAFFMKVNFLAF